MLCVYNMERDSVPCVYLGLNFFELAIKSYLAWMAVESPLRSIFTHYNEFSLTRYKIKDVEKLIEEHEWKMSHCMRTSYALILAPVGSVMFALLICILHCCCYCWCCETYGAGLLNVLAMKQIVDLLYWSPKLPTVYTLTMKVYIRSVCLTTCPQILRIKLNQRVMQQRMILVNVILNARPPQTHNNKSPIETL